MECGPEDVSLLERCPYFRGCIYIEYRLQWSVDLKSLLERCPYFRGCIYIVYRLQWSVDLKMCPY